MMFLLGTGLAFEAGAEVIQITAEAREGGTISPGGIVAVSEGADQTFTFSAAVGYVVSDVVIDGYSKGPVGSYTFIDVRNDHNIVVVFTQGSEPYLGDTAGDDQIYTTSVPISVMLVMSKDHQLFHQAYTDYTDLNGDGNIDTAYDHGIDYYGYFDSSKCYGYDETGGLFVPVRIGTQCDRDGEWSGNFLNWASMARIDILRKALYGGYRSIDHDGRTVLERTFLPQDAHSWVKVYSPDPGDAAHHPPIDWLTPYTGVTSLSICNTTLDSYANPPVMRVAEGSWAKWASSEKWQCACDGEKNTDYDYLRPDKENEFLGEYSLKVEVCNPGLLGAEKCREYENGNIKPIGLLQSLGETDRLHFGLITGSYTKNKSGGVLRKNIGSIVDEIDQTTGKFTRVPGIIETLNSFKIVRYDYVNGSYDSFDNCSGVQGAAFTEGSCTNWGNPIGEMYYEALRYFSGKTGPTAQFDTDDSGIISGLGPVAWVDPYSNTNYCSKPFIIVISDLSPSFDSDQVPGNFFNAAFTGDLAASGLTDIKTETNIIGHYENLSGDFFIGEKGNVKDGQCTEKNMNGELGEVRGLCPQEPGRSGSYYLAGLAHWAKTHDLRLDIPDSGNIQSVNTYALALSSPLPEINIPLGNSTVRVIPACYNDTWNSNASLVHFSVVYQTASTGKFYLNWEDSEQGGDYDMDMEGYLTYDVSGNQVNFLVEITSSSTAADLRMGYIVSGTTEDGIFLLADSNDPVMMKEHTVGTGAASLLKDPLWYAAKWGGFNDLDDDGLPQLQSEWDKDADGVPDTYYLVNNPLKLEEQLNRSFRDIVSRGVSHVAPVISVDETNRTQSGDNVYLAFFKPMSSDHWQGNLKKYGLDLRARTDCGRTEPEWTVVDKDNNLAGNCDGTFKAGSISRWVLPEDNNPYDGGVINEGGVGEVMLSKQMPTDAEIENLSLTVDRFHGFRNIYTYKPDSNSDGSMTPFKRAQISPSDLNVGDDGIRDRIINFVYGYTFDTRAVSGVEGYPVAKRDWILGDIIHSEPVVIDYFGTDGKVEYRFIAVGANDGMLHVFTDEAVTLDNKTYPAGAEVFAFIPGDLLPKLVNFSDPNLHLFMVDGSANLYRASTKIDGYDKKILVFGERRGGRSYWALDISRPDPATWKVVWHIQGGQNGVTTPVTQRIQELGYTWNKPFFTSIRIGGSLVKNIMLFAGGYDPDREDGFPEGFVDIDDDGIWDQGEIHAATSGGTEGYDLYNPGTDIMGRGIFAVDIADGNPLFKAIFAQGGNEVTAGSEQRLAGMKFCFPADMSVIPISESELIIYAADIYGQIWKIAYRYDSDLNGGNWNVKRIFAANPGSDMPSGDMAWFNEANMPALTSTDRGRKVFHSPDVSYFGNKWTARPMLYFGTGDRAHPHYRMIKNRFYAVADFDQMTDETYLLNLTCGELNADADANGDIVRDEGDDQLQSGLTELLFNGSARGFYRILSDQGACVDDSEDHTGEHILNRPVLFFNNVYFTSYQPVLGVPCKPTGNVFIYALDYSFGTSAFNFDALNDTNYKIRNLADSYLKIPDSPIPSGVKIFTRGGEASGLISAGEGVSGVGEDQSTRVPGPPGGVSQLLWETGE